MIAQSESPFYHAEIQKSMYGNLRAVFPIVEMYQAFIPTYPSGFWSFAFASKKYHPVNVITSYSIHYTKLYEVSGFPPNRDL